MGQSVQPVCQLLSVGKGVLDLQQEETTREAFCAGFQCGHLAWKLSQHDKPLLRDIDLVLHLVRHRKTVDDSLFEHYGYLVGWISTYVRTATQRVVLTTQAFRESSRAGAHAYSQATTHPLTLAELTRLLAERHDPNSAARIGYAYGLVEALTCNVHTLKPRIPGEEERTLLPLTTGAPSSPCKVYGHRWHATHRLGIFQCQRCHLMGYCGGCLPHVPPHKTVMCCSAHQPPRARNEVNAHE